MGAFTRASSFFKKVRHSQEAEQEAAFFPSPEDPTSGHTLAEAKPQLFQHIPWGITKEKSVSSEEVLSSPPGSGAYRFCEQRGNRGTKLSRHHIVSPEE